MPASGRAGGLPFEQPGQPERGCSVGSIGRRAVDVGSHSQSRSRVLVPMVLALLVACRAGDERPVTELEGSRWRLLEIQSMDDARGTSRPDDPAKYTLDFGADGRVFARLDCNRGAGTWRQNAADAVSGSLEIGPIAMTRVMCRPPSLDQEVARDLGYVRSYLLRGDRLHLGLMADAGILVYEAAAP